MHRAVLLFLLILVLTFSPNRLQAQVVKGSWTRLDTRPAGEGIVVRLHNGTRIICTLRGTTDGELLVAIHSTAEMRIAKTSVARLPPKRNTRIV